MQKKKKGSQFGDSVKGIKRCVCVVFMNLHTVVTDGAVRAARRAIKATGWAPLHAHLNAFDLHGLVERSTEIVLFVFILLR